MCLFCGLLNLFCLIHVSSTKTVSQQMHHKYTRFEADSFLLGLNTMQPRMLSCNCSIIVQKVLEIPFPVISPLPKLCKSLVAADGLLTTLTLLFSFLLSCCFIFFILGFCSFAFQVLCSLKMLFCHISTPTVVQKIPFVICGLCKIVLKPAVLWRILWRPQHWWDNCSVNRDTFLQFGYLMHNFFFFFFLAVTVCLLFPTFPLKLSDYWLPGHSSPMLIYFSLVSHFSGFTGL